MTVFLSALSQEKQVTVPKRVKEYGEEDSDKLRDVTTTRQVVQDEIGKLEKNKTPDLNEIFLRPAYRYH